MKPDRWSPQPWNLLLGAAVLCLASAGCRAPIGGQTCGEGGYYLRDDIEYLPSEPEFKLTGPVQAIEEYKARQQGLTEPEEEP